MGLAKQQLFKENPPLWPKLEALVDQGVLLHIDLEYARLHTENEEEAMTYCALLHNSRKGHLCLEKDTMDDALELSLSKKTLYLPKDERIENAIVKQVHRLMSYPQIKRDVQENQNLTDKQNQAIAKALRCPFSLITGGPGTGKTFTAAQIVQAFLDQGLNKIILTAPTGKAAANLENKIEQTTPSIQSGTLHYLLNIYSLLDYEKKPISLKADLIIVDECSMMDPLLFAHLLSAIQESTHLVLMGDSNQLSAVEGGSVFADLIDSSQAKIPITQLKKCMRSDKREILDLANSILENTVKILPTIDLKLETGDIEMIYKKLWEHTKNLFPTDFLKDIDSFRILSTLRKGPLGVDALNRFFYEQFEGKTDQCPIMILRNDPKTGLCNGDMGVLLNREKGYFMNRQPIHISDLPAYEYAYCTSVHKSQGSEYDRVLLLIPEGSENFGKQILYTGVTRAKDKIEIAANQEQITKALKENARRKSKISDKIKKSLSFL